MGSAESSEQGGVSEPVRSGRPDATPLSALIDALVRHRTGLLLIFLALLGLWTVSVVVVGPFGPDWLVAYVTGTEFDWGTEPSLSTGGLALLILLLIQFVFLYGGGRIRLGDKPAGVWRVLLPVVVATGAGVVMLFAFGLTLAEMYDRADGWGSIRETPLFTLSEVPIPDSLDGLLDLMYWLVPPWLVWVAVSLVIFKRHDQETALQRLTMGLLAGSWLEFLVALPVDIAIRQRTEDCPCDAGSWWALLVSVPIMMFAFGPALFLLYLREARLGRISPRRARWILLRKTARRRTEPPDRASR